MSLLKQIVDGHVNEFKSLVGIDIDKNKEKIFQSRAKICLNCPLKSGNTCNPALTIDDNHNVETFNSVTMKLVQDPSHPNRKYYLTKEGKKVYKGCGCRLSAKQKSPTSVCPAGFWGGEFN